MIEWYLESRALLRDIHDKAVDALRHCEDDESSLAKTISGYMDSDFKKLKSHWYSMFPGESFGYLGRHIGFGEKQDFEDIIKHDLPSVEAALDAHLIEFQKTMPNYKGEPYVSEQRIKEVSDTPSPNFDMSKLVRLLRELNFAHASESHLTIGILLRAIIDHVPPIFSANSFTEVASNYKGTKSFKASMSRLNDSLRNLADSYLHVQIRRKESLPTFVQVDFRADLDALLGEIVRICEGV